MARRSLWLVPVVVVGAGLVAGWDAAAAAFVGSGLAVASFWISGRALSWSARRSPQALGAATMAGFLLRMALLASSFWVGLQWLGLHLGGLVGGLGASYVLLLLLQTRKELARS